MDSHRFWNHRLYKSYSNSSNMKFFQYHMDHIIWVHMDPGPIPVLLLSTPPGPYPIRKWGSKVDQCAVEQKFWLRKTWTTLVQAFYFKLFFFSSYYCIQIEFSFFGKDTRTGKYSEICTKYCTDRLPDHLSGNPWSFFSLFSEFILKKVLLRFLKILFFYVLVYFNETSLFRPMLKLILRSRNQAL